MRCLFCGSFDPFTIGHKNIVMRALALFDEVVIGIGVNSKKHYISSVQERLDAIRRELNGESRIIVASYDGLTIDFAKKMHVDCIVKGVRNTEDFVYEQHQAIENKKMSGFETLILFADEGFEDISSTKVRQASKK